MVREILEETGFAVKIVRLAGHYTPINRLARPTHLYECSILSGEASLSPETRGVRFYPVNALPRQIPPPYREWIADALSEAPTLYKPLSSVNYPTLFKHLLCHPILIFRFLLARLGWAINSK